MTDEIRAKLEVLAAVECGSNTVHILHSNQCDQCKGTMKRFWPLAGLDMFKPRDATGPIVVIDLMEQSIMVGLVEQCLGMLGSWALECIYGAYHYGSSGGDGVCITSVHTDRLTAAVECLWAAANG